MQQPFETLRSGCVIGDSHLLGDNERNMVRIGDGLGSLDHYDFS